MGLLVVLQMFALGRPHGGLSESAPVVKIPQGYVLGTYAAHGVQRFAGIPYAIPPLEGRRFSRAEVNTANFTNGMLNATRLGPPCIQNPLGDPRPPSTQGTPEEVRVYTT